MTEQDKQLLLQDLCARLPHGVKVWYKYYSENVTNSWEVNEGYVPKDYVPADKEHYLKRF